MENTQGNLELQIKAEHSKAQAEGRIVVSNHEQGPNLEDTFVHQIAGVYNIRSGYDGKSESPPSQDIVIVRQAYAAARQLIDPTDETTFKATQNEILEGLRESDPQVLSGNKDSNLFMALIDDSTSVQSGALVSEANKIMKNLTSDKAKAAFLIGIAGDHLKRVSERSYRKPPFENNSNDAVRLQDFVSLTDTIGSVAEKDTVIRFFHSGVNRLKAIPQKSGSFNFDGAESLLPTLPITVVSAPTSQIKG